MNTTCRAMVFLLLSVVAVGCHDEPITAAAESVTAMAAMEGVVGEEAVQELAKAFAMALADSRVRAEVRDAMRASSLTEHKLVFHEFARTPRGRRLLSAAGNAIGQDLAYMQDLIATLPQLDFYAPFRHDRLGWKATSSYAVAGTLDPDAREIVLFSPTGGSTLTPIKGAKFENALLFLAPAERKSRRVGAQPLIAGEVIQDPDDGELSGSVVYTTVNGRTVEKELADIYRRIERGPDGTWVGTMQECYENCGSTGGGGSAPADTTQFTYFVVYFEDGGLGNNEVEFRTTFRSSTGSVLAYKTLRYENVDSYTGYAVVDDLYFRRIVDGTTERIVVDVIETDTFDDDDYGTGVVHWDANSKVVGSTDLCEHVFDDCTTPWTVVTSAEFILSWTPKS